LRSGYSFALWIVFNVLCATSHDIAELIVMRILAAGAGASVQAVGAGTLADMYIPQERGRAMGWFYIGPLTGRTFSTLRGVLILEAPMIGGPLNERFGWRSTLWFLAIVEAVQFLLLLFGLPETMRTTHLKILVREPSTGSGREPTKWETLNIYIIEPLKLLRLMRYPPVLLAIAYAAIAFGIQVSLSFDTLLIVVLDEHLHYIHVFGTSV
jgi:nitrate/nitrite transporter NarK